MSKVKAVESKAKNLFALLKGRLADYGTATKNLGSGTKEVVKGTAQILKNPGRNMEPYRRGKAWEVSKELLKVKKNIGKGSVLPIAGAGVVAGAAKGVSLAMNNKKNKE